MRAGNCAEKSAALGVNSDERMSQRGLQQKVAAASSDKGIWPQVRKFCGDSSLHAVKYVTDSSTHISERFKGNKIILTLNCIPSITVNKVLQKNNFLLFSGRK